MSVFSLAIFSSTNFITSPPFYSKVAVCAASINLLISWPVILVLPASRVLIRGSSDRVL